MPMNRRQLADPVLAEAARSLMARDAVPTLRVPDGFDLARYQDSVLERFANPALGHRTAQVASDGSLKLPIRLLGTARDRLAAGAEPHLGGARRRRVDGLPDPLSVPCG